MTITDFSRDIVPLINVVLTTAAIIIAGVGLYSLRFLAAQVELARNQVRQGMEQAEQAKEEARKAKNFEKHHAHHRFFLGLPTRELEKELWEALALKDLSCEVVLTENDTDFILSDPRVLVVVRQYLNEFEELCAAVRAGSIDKDFTYFVNSAQVIRTFNTFQEFIIRWRLHRQDPAIYVELEELAKEWAARVKDEQTAHEASLAEQKLRKQRAEEESRRLSRSGRGGIERERV